MFGFSTWKKGWLLLDRHERKQAVAVMCVVILAALSSAGMVGSVMPFLSVLSDPDWIKQVPQFAWLYELFGFTSSYGFLIMLGVGSLVVIVVSSGIQILKTYSVAHFSLLRVHSISYRLLLVYQSRMNRLTSTYFNRQLFGTHDQCKNHCKPQKL